MRRQLNQLRLFLFEKRLSWLRLLLSKQTTEANQAQVEKMIYRVHQKIDKLARSFPLRTLSELSPHIPIKKQVKARGAKN